MNKKIMLFDVDGTIAESGQIMNNTIAKLLNKIKKRVKNIEFGIVGGGKFEKVLYQIDNKIKFQHIFSECGSLYYKLDNDKKKYNLIYKKDIREHKNYNEINILVKKFLKFLSEVDYLLSGTFVDLRYGLIYLSLVGMVATENERKNFIEKDKIFNYRVKLLQILQNEAKNLGIDKDIDILLGGSVGIAIYPKEWNKVQVLDVINKNEYNEIFYFGDKYEEDGNDYKILYHNNVIGIKVDNVEDTIFELNKILKNLK
jgi:phosphomannomutase